MASILLENIGNIDRTRHVLIAGPTASGKSGLALEIAQAGGGVIVNADALQVFGTWRVLTARPSLADEALVPHRLYGHIAADQDYSVGHWLREVAGLLGGERLIIVGGTGLNFTALTQGLAEIPPVPAAVRAEAGVVLRGGLVALVAGLDAETAGRIDLANPARVQRAWEVLRATGRGLADWQRDTGAPLMNLADVVPLVLMPDKDWLGERIDQRFDLMMQHGALDEVRAALPGWNPALASAKAIGAPELIAHLHDGLPLEQAIASAKIASRQYAKRQLTWFRGRMRRWHNVQLP